MGMDLSLNGTGYCVRDEIDFVTGRIVPNGKARGPLRLHYNRKAMRCVLDSYPDITQAVVEGYSMGSVGRLADIGEWGGIVRLELFERGIPAIVVAPTTLKKAVVGKGNATKEQVINFVKAQTGRILLDDEADAWALTEFFKNWNKVDTSGVTTLYTDEDRQAVFPVYVPSPFHKRERRRKKV